MQRHTHAHTHSQRQTHTHTIHSSSHTPFQTHASTHSCTQTHMHLHLSSPTRTQKHIFKHVHAIAQTRTCSTDSHTEVHKHSQAHECLKGKSLRRHTRQCMPMLWESSNSLRANIMGIQLHVTTYDTAINGNKTLIGLIEMCHFGGSRS